MSSEKNYSVPFPIQIPKLYFPSEFGADQYKFDHVKHVEWESKKQHFQLVEQLLPTVKICWVFQVSFLDESIGPWFGFDTKEGNIRSLALHMSL